MTSFHTSCRSRRDCGPACRRTSRAWPGRPGMTNRRRSGMDTFADRDRRRRARRRPRTRTATCRRRRSCPSGRRAPSRASTRRSCARSARRSCSATRTTCTCGPGEELIAELGGLHAFMGWDGPILTDSGGYQVFSLRHTITRADDEGVTFRSVYDGDLVRLTPETAAAIQRTLGSDIAMCLDHVPPPGVARADLERAVRRTTQWAARQRAADRAPRPAAVRHRAGPHRRGAPPPLDRRARGARLRRLRARRARDRRGPRARCSRRRPGRRRCSRRRSRATSWASATRAGILDVIERGIDMFDCVWPTRLGRTGTALTWEGRLNLKNARFARDPAPLDENCALPGVHALLPRVPPAPREPERAARAAAPVAA